MDRHDIPTTVAIGFTITAFSTIGHEAIGHGAACVLTGCDPVQFSSTYFIGNKTGLSDSAIRTISMGGTLFNLVLGLVFLALLRMIGPGAPARRYYVLWFGSMVNLVSATGYIFFGSAFAFGDFRTILEGAGWPLRIGCILLGGVLYFGALWVAARDSDPLLGSGPDRRSRLFALVLRREGGGCAEHRAKPRLVDRGGPRCAGSRSRWTRSPAGVVTRGNASSVGSGPVTAQYR
jgi:hypothetical protein